MITDRGWYESDKLDRHGNITYMTKDRPRIYSDEVPMADYKTFKSMEVREIVRFCDKVL